MSNRSSELSTRLKSEFEKTLEFFQGLRDDQWRIRLNSDDGRWTVQQVLAHLVASERGFRQLIQGVLAGGSGSPDDFDLDKYNQRKVEEIGEKPPQELLEIFSIRRQKMIDFVKSIPDEKLDLRGRHPFIGEASLEEMIKLLYHHNRMHIREIQKTLELESI